jgi:hypothetical protein
MISITKNQYLNLNVFLYNVICFSNKNINKQFNISIGNTDNFNISINNFLDYIIQS